MPAEKKKLKIEFVGDSLTAAFGINAQPGDPYTTNTEDVSVDYASVCAEKLDADYSVIGISGASIYPYYYGYEDSPERSIMMYNYPNMGWCDDKFDKIDPLSINWDFENNQPDIVVLNMGSNDEVHAREYSDINYPVIVEKYVEFLGQIRAKNPNALLINAYGMDDHNMCDLIKQAMSQYSSKTGDTKLGYCEFPLQDIENDGVGTLNHPNAKTNEKDGNLLADYIRSTYPQYFENN